jgi:YidC/Oxa1 family membrane protein insertase
MLTILKTIFYYPLYNIFVVFLNIPGIDAGMAVVLFTCVVKLALFPISKKALRSQIEMKEIEPEIKKIKEQYAKDQQMLAKKTMELYKEKGINPFSSFIVILIQIPIIFSLYHIFSSGAISSIDTEVLYGFVSAPESVKTVFLGLFDILAKNHYLAAFTAITQFVQAWLQPIPVQSVKPGEKPSFQHDFARSMSMQMKYVFPVVVFFISYNLPAVIALYWITSNIFTIAQEIFLREDRKYLNNLHK